MVWFPRPKPIDWPNNPRPKPKPKGDI